MKRGRHLFAAMRRIGIRGKVFAAYIAVLVLAMILCSALVSHYVESFLRQRTKEYSLRGMSGVVYELDSLYQRLEQFVSTVYDRDFYRVTTESGRAYTYKSLTRQIEFDSYVRNNLLLGGLKDDTVGMLAYVDDNNYYYVGDGVVRRGMAISETPWYRQFEDSGQDSVFIGPLTEDYRPHRSSGQEVVLYLRRVNVPASAATDQVPFVMMIVRKSRIEERFVAYFGDNGALVSGPDGEIVYTGGIAPEQAGEIADLLAQGAFQPEGGSYSSYSNADMLVTNVYAPHFGWNIAAVNPAAEIYADVARVVTTINLMFAACGLLGILLAWYLSRRVMIPIQTLGDMIDRMEQSEDAFIEVTSRDEVGRIGRRFNAMKRRLQELTGKMYISEVREKQAQLHALQAQINPHFLYNTLDNIYCIAQIEGVDTIARLIHSLSAMMRYSIDTKGAAATLGEELDHVRQYIDVLNLRFDGCIDYAEQVDLALLDIPVMKLILQPVVENAWVHGIARKQSRRGRIELSAEVRGDTLVIAVEDDGVGMDETALADIGAALSGVSPLVRDTDSDMSIALRNVNDRIKLHCGEDFGVSIENATGCRVTLTLRC